MMAPRKVHASLATFVMVMGNADPEVSRISTEKYFEHNFGYNFKINIFLFLYFCQFLCIVRIDTCITEGGYTCAFPFEWGGKTYNKCTMDGGYSKPWCYQREGSWGYCESGSCLGDNKIMDTISGHKFYKIYPILHLNLTEELFLLCNYIRMYLQRSFIV